MNGVAVRRLLSLSTRAAAYGSAVFLAAMMLITVADVILRAFKSPIAGAYDLVQLFLVGTVFLSVPEVFLRDENILVDLVDHIAVRTLVAALKVLANLAGVVFLALLSWRMIAPTVDAVRFGEVSPDLAIPMGIHCALMVAGLVLALLAAAAMLLGSLRVLFPRKDWR